MNQVSHQLRGNAPRIKPIFPATSRPATPSGEVMVLLGVTSSFGQRPTTTLIASSVCLYNTRFLPGTYCPSRSLIYLQISPTTPVKPFDPRLLPPTNFLLPTTIMPRGVEFSKDNQISDNPIEAGETKVHGTNPDVRYQLIPLY